MSAITLYGLVPLATLQLARGLSVPRISPDPLRFNPSGYVLSNVVLRSTIEEYCVLKGIRAGSLKN